METSLLGGMEFSGQQQNGSILIQNVFHMKKLNTMHVYVN